MPALDPVCANTGRFAGTPDSATAAAAAIATAREAGFTGRALLGGPALIMGGEVRVLLAAMQTKDETRQGQHMASASRITACVTKPAECSISGAGWRGER